MVGMAVKGALKVPSVHRVPGAYTVTVREKYTKPVSKVKTFRETTTSGKET